MFNNITYKKTRFGEIVSNNYEAPVLNLAVNQVITVEISNNTEFNLMLAQKELVSGKWDRGPSLIVESKGYSFFSSKGTIATGTEGFVEYYFPTASFLFRWVISNSGNVNHKLDVTDPSESYKVTYEGQFDRAKITVNEK